MEFKEYFSATSITSLIIIIIIIIIIITITTTICTFAKLSLLGKWHKSQFLYSVLSASRTQDVVMLSFAIL